MDIITKARNVPDDFDTPEFYNVGQDCPRCDGDGKICLLDYNIGPESPSAAQILSGELGRYVISCTSYDPNSTSNDGCDLYGVNVMTATPSTDYDGPY